MDKVFEGKTLVVKQNPLNQLWYLTDKTTGEFIGMGYKTEEDANYAVDNLVPIAKVPASSASKALSGDDLV